MLSKLSRVAGAVVFTGLVCGALSLAARDLKIQLPLETAVFKTAPGSEMANAQCLTCHSVEYVEMQPPKPLDFWAAEVKKMREKYGAQFSKDYDQELADYLAKNYGTATNIPASAVLSASAVVSSSQPADAVAFATKYGCLSCHKVNVKVVGPAFKDVAAKYRNDPAALDKIAQQIHNGGSGKWGPAVMPPYRTIVSDAQVEMLGRWILSQDTVKQ